VRNFRILFARPDETSGTFSTLTLAVEAREIDGAIGMALADARRMNPDQGWSRMHVVAVIERPRNAIVTGYIEASR